ncbi:MAG: zf-HC2 domain-containing protein [Chloroflexia bacterium]|nr:zf-HC2 domain-containing protein [Chloroflexia bacterium]
MTGQDELYASAHPEPELLAEYADGEMDDERTRPVAAHLQTCARCRSEVESYGSMAALLSNLPQRPAPRSFALDELVVRRERRAPIWPAWASLAASIVLAIGMINALGGLSGGGMSASLTAGSTTPDAADQGGLGGTEAGQQQGDAAIAPGVAQNAEPAQDTGAGAEATSAAGEPAARESKESPVQETDGAQRESGRPTVQTAKAVDRSVSGGFGASALPSPIATLVADTPAIADALTSPTPVTRVEFVAPTVTPVLVRDTPPASEVAFGDGAGNGLLALLLGAMSALTFAFSAYFFVRARTA